MAIISTMYVRVVRQDRSRGFMLLVGYESKIVQSTATQWITMSNITRASLNATIEMVARNYNAIIKDITDEGVKKQLAKEFGEEVPKEKKPKKEQTEA